MKCPNVKLVSSYFDGELRGEQKAMFESHLQGCADCARELEGMRAIRDMLSGTEKHRAPYGFSTRVLAQAEELENRNSRRTPRRMSWFIPAFVKVAEAVAMLLVVSIGIIAGGIMTGQNMVMPTAASNPANLVPMLSLEIFEPTPPGSLGGAYLALMEAGNER